MSNTPTPSITLRTIELPANAWTSVWASRARQAREDVKIIFLVFTFLGFGVAGIARSLWFSDFYMIHSVVLAISSGLLASLCMIFLHFLDFPSIRKDLISGFCIEADVYCELATRVRIAGSSLEGIALDCGDDVLVLIGDWWTNRNRTDIWIVPKSWKKFPGQRFRIRYLPRSGKVLAVFVESGPLPVSLPEPIEPLISLPFSKYSEVVHVEQNLKSLTLDEGNAQT